MIGTIGAAGDLGLHVVRGGAPHSFHRELRDRLLAFTPRTDLGRVVRQAVEYLPPQLALDVLDVVSRIGVIETALEIKVLRNIDSRFWLGAAIEDYGVVSRRVVTDAFVAAVVDALDSGVGFTLSDFKYHGIGTGSTAESAAQTALVTELTTEYTGNVRATGTATQPSANIYRSTATNTLDSGTPALREHSVFTQAATGGGTMLDRSLYAAINLDGTVGDGLQSQYSITFTSGG